MQLPKFPQAIQPVPVARLQPVAAMAGPNSDAVKALDKASAAAGNAELPDEGEFYVSNGCETLAALGGRCAAYAVHAPPLKPQLALFGLPAVLQELQGLQDAGGRLPGASADAVDLPSGAPPASTVSRRLLSATGVAVAVAGAGPFVCCVLAYQGGDVLAGNGGLVIGSTAAQTPTFPCNTMQHCSFMLLLLQGAPPAGPEVFEDVGDTCDWVSTLLDGTLEQVDDAVAAARQALQQGPAAALPAGVGLAGASGVGAQAPAAAAAAPPQGRRGSAGGSGGGFVSYMNSQLQRPQEAFDEPVDNSRAPFQHKLDSLSGVVDVEAAGAATAAAAAAGAPRPHPLQHRLEGLQYPALQLVQQEAQPPKGYEETPFTYIDTVPALRAAGEQLRHPLVTSLLVLPAAAPGAAHEQQRQPPGWRGAASRLPDARQHCLPTRMLSLLAPTPLAAERLAAAKEIAIDLEAHSYRSFQASPPGLLSWHVLSHLLSRHCTGGTQLPPLQCLAPPVSPCPMSWPRPAQWPLSPAGLLLPDAAEHPQ